jgi:inositol 1,4,5-triphosphate receptor type 1
LDTAEGEGDQLDVKSLQNQLEKTQDLVGQLSKQLSELKDQVSDESKSWNVKRNFLFF